MSTNDNEPLSELDAQLMYQILSPEDSDDGNHRDEAVASTSTASFDNSVMNSQPTIEASAHATSDFNTTPATAMVNGQAIMTSRPSSNNVLQNLNNWRVFEVKTGEPTSNYHHENYNYARNNSEMARSSSESMLADMMPLGASFGGYRTEASSGNNNFNRGFTDASQTMNRRQSEPASMLLDDNILGRLMNEGQSMGGQKEMASLPIKRRNSEPASILFDDKILGQLLNEGEPRGAREEIFADGFHSPPPLETATSDETNRLSNSTGQQPSSPQASTQSSNWDLFRMPSPAPIRGTTDDEDHTDDILLSQPSSTVTSVATKTGEDFDRSMYVFDRYSEESGRSRQQRKNPPMKRSRSLDPMEMHASYPAGSSHQNSDAFYVFHHLNPGDQGFQNREIPKRRRSEPLLTDDMFPELSGAGYHKSPSSSSSASVPFQVGSNNIQLENTETRTHVLPSYNMSQTNSQYVPASRQPLSPQLSQQLPNDVNSMKINPLATSAPLHQNSHMPYVSPTTAPQTNTLLNPNIASATSNDYELSNIVDAITETHNNLQRLQSAVAQCQDQEAVENITKAFELTAASSQYVVESQYHMAFNMLNQAWANIKVVENRLASMSMSAGRFPASFGPYLNEMPPTQLSINEPLCLPQKSKKKKAPKAPKPKHTELEELPPPSKDDPEIIMTRLNALMQRTVMSQINLQKYDKQNGLPRSHAQTMVHSSRSRKQLQKGIVLKKWDGQPLIQGNSKRTQEEVVQLK